MQENQTTVLLKKCQAGAKTAISSLKEVLDDVDSAALRNDLVVYLNKHEYINNEIGCELEKRGEKSKEPSPTAKMMSWIKINIKLLEKPRDKTVAKLMLEGCNMGISQLSEYINTFTQADERAKEIAERLLSTEEELGVLLRKYL